MTLIEKRFGWQFVFQVYYLSSATCSELLSRHRRSWIIGSFTIEEGHPGPFPYVLGKVRKPQCKKINNSDFVSTNKWFQQKRLSINSYQIHQSIHLFIIINSYQTLPVVCKALKTISYFISLKWALFWNLQSFFSNLYNFDPNVMQIMFFHHESV